MTWLRDMFEQSQNASGGTRREGFVRSEDGSFIIFGLMIFIMILTAGGMGVDFIRYETERARLQATLDRAVLAAASLDQPLDPTEVVLDYVARADLGQYVTADDITVYESPVSRSVDVNVSMEVPSIFLNFVGITELNAPASATAQQIASQTEVALVLDVSGSMGRTASGTTKSRVEVLQSAASTFVNMLMCDPTDPTKETDCTIPQGSTAISIVPYSEQVAVGEDILSHLNVTDEHNYSHCVHFDANDFLSTGITEDTALQRAGHFDPWTGFNWWTSAYAAANDWPCHVEPEREIVAFEDHVPTLQDRIDGLAADGNTSIDVGMKWGAALLDPDFEPVLAAMIDDGLVSNTYEDFPLSWETSGVQKVIVLMTDGVNTAQHYLYDEFRSGPSEVFTSMDDDLTKREHSLYNADADEYYWLFLDVDDVKDYPMDRPYGVGLIPECTDPDNQARPSKWSDPSKCHWVDGPGALALDYTEVWANYTWKWWESWSFLDEPGNWHDNSEKNARLKDMCTAAKDEGMKIFTIGFDTRRTQEAILKTCASKPGYFYDADGVNLESIFAEIAREVSKLKLVN